MPSKAPRCPRDGGMMSEEHDAKFGHDELVCVTCGNHVYSGSPEFVLLKAQVMPAKVPSR